MSRGGDDFSIILQELVKPGSLVKKGDVVAEFDRQYMLNRLDDYKAAVIQSEAGFRKEKAENEVSLKAHEQVVRSAQAAVEKARLDMKTTPVRSAIQSERLKLALEEADARHKQLLEEVKFVEIKSRADLRGSEIDLQQVKVEQKRAEANADKLVIKAPIDGLTVMRQTFRGAEYGQIQPGDQLHAGHLFMQIVDPSSMVVSALLNQVDVESLRIGQRARIRIDAFPDIELPGRVMSIGAITRVGGYRASYKKEIPVRLKLEKLDPRIIPDLSVSAEVTLESERQASAMVPLGAVFTDGTSGRPYVFVRSNGAWQRREVDLGLRNYLSAVVRAGLNAGDTIALERPAEKAGAASSPSP